ncbi:MAG: ABC transporter permease [Candidatus Aminicenantaceae bacterium]
MLKNYLKIALRNFFKRKSYSLITVTGLALGLTACFLISLYVKQELSYDRFHENADRIFRLAVETTRPESIELIANTPFPVAEAFKQDYPEIDSVARLYSWSSVLVQYQDLRFVEQGWFFADPEFFTLFSFPFLKGDPAHALDSPESLVISASMAEKYFGDTDPIGQTLRMQGKHEFQVTGVVADSPVNSHVHFSFAASFQYVTDELVGYSMDEWGAFSDLFTYVLLPTGMQPADLSLQIEGFMMRHGDYPPGIDRRVFLQPLTSIHLKSHLDGELEQNTHISNLIILGTIGLFLLLIACINYINLATASSAKRAREVGLRKVLGAEKTRLIRQFLTESVLIAMLALLLSLFLVELTLPTFSALVGTPVNMSFAKDFGFLLGIALLTLAVGIFSGLYPALFLSGYQPVKVLKGTPYGGRGSAHQGWLRKGLVVAQFALSILLIVGTLLVNQQLHYLRNARMGFDKEHMVMLPIFQDQQFFDEGVNEDYETVKYAIQTNPAVSAATACFKAPLAQYAINVSVYPYGAQGENRYVFNLNFVDFDYIDTFDLEMIAGRNFSKDFATDYHEAFILNEAAVRRMGYPSPEEALGKKFTIGIRNMEGTVIGVTRDYHIASLRENIEPLILLHWPSLFSQVAVKINGQNIPTALAHLEETWNTFRPDSPFQYSFLDENIGRIYAQEAQTSAIVRTFSLIAVFIACLGLFGLASFTAEKRTKEIGVRKVLGASVSQITYMLSTEFTKWVLLANVVAWPLAYWAMHSWLSGFAYRTTIGIWPFLLAAAASLVIALLTVSFQAVRAAAADPVKSLRHE